MNDKEKVLEFNLTFILIIKLIDLYFNRNKFLKFAQIADLSINKEIWFANEQKRIKTHLYLIFHQSISRGSKNENKYPSQIKINSLLFGYKYAPIFTIF